MAMSNQEIVQQLWKECDVLRDDGVTYQDYVTELTYILFLKMSKEQDEEKEIPEKYRWDNLLQYEGLDLMNFYRQLLLDLGNPQKTKSTRINAIYDNASTSIDEPANLEKIIHDIDGLDWFSARQEGLGALYEGLLEKNANETKSGAGQYFTPRPLINMMVRMTKPQIGERLNDPAAGTFGFMVAANDYLSDQTDEFFDLSQADRKFEKESDFSNIKYISENDAIKINERSQVSEGDVLFAMIGTIGNPVLVRTRNNFSIKNVALLKQIAFLNMNFVCQYILGSTKLLMKNASGGNQKFISLKKINKLPFPLPPLSEQSRIVSKLEQLFTLIG